MEKILKKFYIAEVDETGDQKAHFDHNVEPYEPKQYVARKISEALEVDIEENEEKLGNLTL